MTLKGRDQRPDVPKKEMFGSLGKGPDWDSLDS